MATEDDAHLIETRLDSEVVFQGSMLHVRRDRIRLPDASESTREYVVHPGAALIVPVLADGRFVLERQFRYPVGRVMLEFPAGKIDPGESSFATAQRELVEEIGYTARTWTPIGTIHPQIGYSTEFIDVFAATDLDTRRRRARRRRVPRGGHDDRGRVARRLRSRRVHRRQEHRRAFRVATPALSPVAYRVVVHGRVQGVGYRDAAVQAALRERRAGWVRNRADGTVELRRAGRARGGGALPRSGAGADRRSRGSPTSPSCLPPSTTRSTRSTGARRREPHQPRFPSGVAPGTANTSFHAA